MSRHLALTTAVALLLVGHVQAFSPVSGMLSGLGLRKSVRPACGLRMSAPTEGTMAFTQEMRNKAMSLHTFSQAPKEGTVKDQNANTVVAEWQTTAEDFMQFLVDSRTVYTALEEAVKKPALQTFVDTGLERVEALNKDIKYLQEEYKLSVPPTTEASSEYASFLLNLAEKNPPAFVCHFYNYYFAHTAGGRMIGKKVMDESFGGYLFEFYQWEGDVKDTLTAVKGRIDKLAESWTREQGGRVMMMPGASGGMTAGGGLEQKDAALDATPETFKKSGALLRVLVGKARERAVAMVNKVQVKGGKITKVPEAAYSLRKSAWDL